MAAVIRSTRTVANLYYYRPFIINLESIQETMPGQDPLIDFVFHTENQPPNDNLVGKLEQFREDKRRSIEQVSTDLIYLASGKKINVSLIICIMFIFSACVYYTMRLPAVHVSLAQYWQNSLKASIHSSSLPIIYQPCITGYDRIHIREMYAGIRRYKNII